MSGYPGVPGSIFFPCLLHLLVSCLSQLSTVQHVKKKDKQTIRQCRTATDQTLYPQWCKWGGMWCPAVADCKRKYLWQVLIPVTGASMSSIVFSWRRIAAPSLMIRSATASSTRPSLVRWAFRRSTRGFPSQSNTSFNVRRWLRGKGTAEDRAQAHGDIKTVGGITVTMTTVNATNNSPPNSCFILHCCERIVANTTQEWCTQHIMKEFMQKSYLRKPHPCSACRHYCAAAASIHSSLLSMYTSLAWKPSL